MPTPKPNLRQMLSLMLRNDRYSAALKNFTDGYVSAMAVNYDDANDPCTPELEADLFHELKADAESIFKQHWLELANPASWLLKSYGPGQEHEILSRLKFLGMSVYNVVYNDLNLTFQTALARPVRQALLRTARNTPRLLVRKITRNGEPILALAR